MITSLALMSIHKSPIIPLSEICERYFSLTYAEALRRAGTLELPVPVFRLTESRKAPLMVTCEALGAFIDKQHAAAEKVWLHAQV